MKTTAIVLLATLALASCDEQGPPDRTFNEEAGPRYTVDQVADRAGLRSDQSIEELKARGIKYDIRSWNLGSCEVDVILTSRGEIETYAGAGDPVVTNEAGDVGVVFDGHPDCRERLLKALEKVP